MLVSFLSSAIELKAVCCVGGPNIAYGIASNYFWQYFRPINGLQFSTYLNWCETRSKRVSEITQNRIVHIIKNHLNLHIFYLQIWIVSCNLWMQKIISNLYKMTISIAGSDFLSSCRDIIVKRQFAFVNCASKGRQN